MSEFREITNRIIVNVEKVVIGKRPVIQLALTGLLCDGHFLLEDVPGVAKTMLVRALAISMGCSFNRIQCTPDLLPSDVTGVSVFNQKTTEFEFRKGPIFSQIILADEINRATPRAQSALLEAMAERQVSVDGVTYKLDPPFSVAATQNPIEHEGVFPLPEAQLDRFLMKLSMGYPSFDAESSMLDRLREVHPIDTIDRVVGAEEVVRLQAAVRQVFVHPKVKQYILKLVEATRDNLHLYLGASPRASLALYRTGQATAALRGSDFVIPDDIKFVARAVIEHRIAVKPESRLRKITTGYVLDEILKTVPVPVGTAFRK